MQEYESRSEHSGQRLGFAWRAENFAAVKAMALDYEGEAVSVSRLTRAVLMGTPGLSHGEAKLLALLVGFLNAGRIAEGEAFVYPSNDLLCRLLGCDDSGLRRLKRRLEAAGYLVRNYTPANRPVPRKGLDLRPLLGRLGELEATIERAVVAHRAEVERYLSSETYEETQSAGEAGKSSHLEQSQPILLNPVPPQHTQDRKKTTNTETQTSAKNCSSTRASRFMDAKSPIGVASPEVKSELLKVWEISSVWRRYVSREDVTSGDLLKLVTRTQVAIAELMPDRNTATHTWEWAVRNHGWKALLMFVAATDDSTVRDHQRYLGWLALPQNGSVDLAGNFRRIAEARRRAAAAPSATPAIVPAILVGETATSSVDDMEPEDPDWQELKRQLVPRIGEPAMRCWIDKLAFHGLESDALVLSAPSHFIVNWVRQNYEQQILAAARKVGLPVARIKLVAASL